jgi:DNA-binding SARP family transcriptional activator
LKLSTVYSNYGDPTTSIVTAEAGVALAPDDAVATRLRLEGNLAITRTWLTQNLSAVADECRRISDEASALGLEHFAAIGRHNAGCALLRLGQFEDALHNLEQAAAVWSDQPTSPFADNAELVTAMLALGQIDRARAAASDAVVRTAPWPRPHADALAGQAGVLINDGRASEAVAALEVARGYRPFLGGLHAVVDSRLIEALFLANRSAEITQAAKQFDIHTPDPRHAAESCAARGIAMHERTDCQGECLDLISELDAAEEHGELSTAAWGRVKFGILALRHGGRAGSRWAWEAVIRAQSMGLWPSLRSWLRLYAPYASSLIRTPDGSRTLAALSAFDPDAWRPSLIPVLKVAKGNDRTIVIETISRIANRDVLAQLAGLPGSDVANLRRHLQYLQAPRLFLRTMGGVALHRAAWDGPQISIEKKRVRMLLAVLAAHHGSNLSRDVALDILWPDAAADSAINSLNQTVFQLRRYIDSGYRGGPSPEYVISTSDHIGLNPDLVHTDLSEIRKLPSRLATGDWRGRQEVALRAIRLIRGEFLADLRYEDWANRQQLSIHADIREKLLPIALAAGTSFELDVAAQAATALLQLDPFDEGAILALAHCLSRSGRRAAARKMVVDFLRKLESELDLQPTADFQSQAAGLGMVN